MDLSLVSVIALGIGATTAAFTLLDYVLLRPLPFSQPEQLVLLYQTDLTRGVPRIAPQTRQRRERHVEFPEFQAVGNQVPGAKKVAPTPCTRSNRLRDKRLNIPPRVVKTDGHHLIADGTRTVSPVARHAVVTVLPLTTPPEWLAASSARDLSCCLRPEREGSASGIIFCRGHHWIHLRCGPVTRSPSRRWLCRSASFPPQMRPVLQGF